MTSLFIIRNQEVLSGIALSTKYSYGGEGRWELVAIRLPSLFPGALIFPFPHFVVIKKSLDFSRDFGWWSIADSNR